MATVHIISDRRLSKSVYFYVIRTALKASENKKLQYQLMIIKFAVGEIVQKVKEKFKNSSLHPSLKNKDFNAK